MIKLILILAQHQKNITFDFQWQRNSINCSDGFYYSECNDDGNFLDGEPCGNGGECLLLEENWFDIVDEKF